MTRNTIGALLTVSLLVLGSAGALAQAAGGSDPHHPAAADEKSPPPAAQSAAAPPAAPGDMPGMMGMMTPEMMQMMQQMMRMQGDGGARAGIMASGVSMCPGMSMMMPMMMPVGMGGPGEMMRGGMGAGIGPGMFYSATPDGQEEMTAERVRTWLQERLERHGNPRLKIGKVAAASGGEIVAEIVTAEGSLVQKLAFNRYPGFVRVVR